MTGLHRRSWPALLALLLVATGCPHARPAAPPAAVGPSGMHPFLWRVDGAARPSYLLGSFHVGVDPDEVLPPSVWAKLEASRVVVLEVDIAVPEALGLGRQPPGHTLDQEMSPEEWHELVKRLGADPSAADQLKQVKAWVIVTQLIQELVPETRSIDTVAQDRARERGIERVFLEDVKFQEALFDKFMTAQKLLALLDDTEHQRALLAAQADAYRSGDEDRMYAQSLAPEVFAHSPPGAREELVFARNRAWIPRLVPHLDRGGAFVVVGTSHLIGEGGVIDLLRRRGYRITRIDG